MTVLFLLLLLASAVCFLAVAFGGNFRNVNLVGLGLLFWVLVPLIQAFQALGD